MTGVRSIERDARRRIVSAAPSGSIRFSEGARPLGRVALSLISSTLLFKRIVLPSSSHLASRMMAFTVNHGNTDTFSVRYFWMPLEYSLKYILLTHWHAQCVLPKRSDTSWLFIINSILTVARKSICTYSWFPTKRSFVRYFDLFFHCQTVLYV